MYKYPSIEQFRNVIKRVIDKSQYGGVDDNGNIIRNYAAKPPVLTFQGTVKAHGTNGAVVWDIENDNMYFQSRERILSLTSDNAGFYLHMRARENVLKDIMNKVLITHPKAKTIAMYGEWCGSGIQKGVAISQLPKMFLVFSIKVIDGDDTQWFDIRCIDINDTENSIFNIMNFCTWTVSIDFDCPALIQNTLIDYTMNVEEECPIGKYFGVSGVGEGIVWTCLDKEYGSSFIFKTKGEKHSVSKVKTLAEVDVSLIENINIFVDSVVTDNRLEQGLDIILRERGRSFDMKSMGEFLKWVCNDIYKEEEDTIVANAYDTKKINKSITDKAKRWYMDNLNSEKSL
jgi:hypothetical protein